jgi:hypothetical protein
MAGKPKLAISGTPDSDALSVLRRVFGKYYDIRLGRARVGDDVWDPVIRIYEKGGPKKPVLSLWRE